MSKRHRKLVQEGEFAAEVEVELITTEKAVTVPVSKMRAARFGP